MEVEGRLRNLAVLTDPVGPLYTLEAFVLGWVRVVTVHPVPVVVVVCDRPRRRAIGDRCVDGTRQADRQRLVGLADRIAVDLDLDRLRRFAWREGDGVYWIENTLTNSIPAREMLAIAEQTLPVVNTIRGVVLRPPARSVKLPPRTGPGVSLFSKLAGALGLASLAALVALALAVLAQHRELAGLRAQVSQAMALEARQRPLLAGAPAGAPAAAAASAADRAPTIYRARRRWRPGAIAVALAAPLAGVAVAVLLMSPGSSSPAREGIPIAVFNATAKRGAAHAVAAKLRTRHLHVSKIGPIKDASLSKGAYVLYPPGAQRQARQVAGLISSLSPTVAAIQPAVQSAVGGRNEIVVVLD